MKTARDLLLLSAVAFNQNKFEDAGALFASALSAADAPELLQELNKIGQPDAEPLQTESVSSSGMTLSQIAKSLSSAIGENVAVAGDDADEEESEDEEDEEEDSESTSSAAPQSNIQRRSKGERKLITSVNSPIKLKQ